MARILIIDDDDLICSSVKTILEKEGYEVDTSLSGESGVEKVKGTNYDLIYLDINIPGMNSLATFRAIKSIKKDAIVCILTGMADESMSEYLLLIEEGAIDKVIRKPIDKDMLLKITGELVENKGSRKKILIVDDDDLIEEAFGAVLKNFDYDLSFAKSGKEATGLFRQGNIPWFFWILTCRI
jgi:DNA-binding response OmpR family regulator